MMECTQEIYGLIVALILTMIVVICLVSSSSHHHHRSGYQRYMDHRFSEKLLEEKQEETQMIQPKKNWFASKINILFVFWLVWSTAKRMGLQSPEDVKEFICEIIDRISGKNRRDQQNS